MDIKTLESLRIRKLFKLITLNFLNTIALVTTFFLFTYIQDIISFIILFVLGSFFIDAYFAINSIPMNYKNNVKKYLLTHMIKCITNNEDEIKWLDARFKQEKKDEVINKLDQLIDKQCNIKHNIKNTDKSIDYISEFLNLKKKESLTPSEQQRLQELNNYIYNSTQKIELENAERYKIRLTMLRKLENTLSNSQENIWEIEYLRSENKKYEEYIQNHKNTEELELLRKKNSTELTEEERKRIEYLSNKIHEYITNRTKKETDPIIDSATCISNVFNNCTIYVPYLLRGSRFHDHGVRYDNIFYGNYKNIEFLTLEAKEKTIFYGTVIRIPIKVDFNNTLFMQRKSAEIPINGINTIKKGLNNLNLGDSLNKKYKVFAQSHNEVSKIIDSQFIEYVNNSKNNFSYLFKKNYAYILYPHKKDYFKIGSLFKNAKDKQQYEACKQYLILMFQELEKFASNTWAKKQ